MVPVVALELVDFPATGRIQDCDVENLAPGGEILTIGSPGQTFYWSRVPLIDIINLTSDG